MSTLCRQTFSFRPGQIQRSFIKVAQKLQKQSSIYSLMHIQAHARRYIASLPHNKSLSFCSDHTSTTLTAATSMQVPSGATWVDVNIRAKLDKCVCVCVCSMNPLLLLGYQMIYEGKPEEHKWAYLPICIHNRLIRLKTCFTFICIYTIHSEACFTFMRVHLADMHPHRRSHFDPLTAVDTSDKRLMVLHCQQLRPHKAPRDAHMLVRVLN